MLERWFAPISTWWPLPLRIVVGIVFAAHGYQKIFVQGVENVAKFFGPGFAPNQPGLDLPLPEVFAWIVSYAEFLGGICLILGLFTRYASLLLIIDMIVAILRVKLGGGLLGGRGYELELLLLGGALTLLWGGPGLLSLEKMLFRKEL